MKCVRFYYLNYHIKKQRELQLTALTFLFLYMLQVYMAFGHHILVRHINMGGDALV